MMTLNELRDSIYKNYYKQVGFNKENSYYSMKHQQRKRSTIICYLQPN